MLAAAKHDYPNCKIVIKAHAETISGRRPGYFSAADKTDDVQIPSQPTSPWPLFEGAKAVYTHSSQMGFKSILAGHKQSVFGQPFYPGWGLSHDMSPLGRRRHTLAAAQLFAAAIILYPIWYDP
jgi:capsular polysaccharide export protein